MIIAKQAVILGFEPGVAWAQKVLQLYTITQVKHGMCRVDHRDISLNISLNKAFFIIYPVKMLPESFL